MHKRKKFFKKIKFSINKKYNLAAAAFGILAMFSALWVPQLSQAAAQQAADSGILANPGTYSGLPVSGVKAYPLSNSKGTVILIPQYHRDPSSTNINDPANDSGVRNQQQTTDILKRLSEQDHVSLIMVEGDLQGEVPQSKIDHLTAEVAARDQFKQNYDALKQTMAQSQTSSASTKQLYSQLDQELNYVDRDIYLQGAPYIVKAQGDNVTLIGAENQQTLDEAANVVRDYVYLNDRMTQVKQASASGRLQPNAVVTASNGGGLQQMIQQLMKGQSASGGGSMPQMLQQMMGGKSALTGSSALGSSSLQQMLGQLSGKSSIKTFGNSGTMKMGKSSMSLGGVVAGGNFQQMLQQMMGGKSALTGGTDSALGGSSALQQLIRQMMGKTSGTQGSATQSLVQLKTSAQAQGNTRLVSALTDLGQSYQNLQTDSQTFVQPSTATAPSRANNPYASISDTKKLQDLMDQNQQQINAVVIGKRNQEAASGLAQAMQTYGQNVSVLQFGAGHEEGLIDELHKQNLSVVVVTTNEVAARAGQQN